MLYYARNPSERSRDDVAFWDYVNPQYLNDCLDNYSHVVLSTTVFDAAADEADEDDADADFGADGDRDDDGEDHLDDDDDDDDVDDDDDGLGQIMLISWWSTWSKSEYIVEPVSIVGR